MRVGMVARFVGTGLAVCFMVLFIGCSVELKDDWYFCEDSTGCPEHWFCSEDHTCQSGSTSEATFDLCSNNVDDDGVNGADCLDPGCLSNGHCWARDQICDPLTQTGCPTGMGCYLRFVAETAYTYCRLEGDGVAGAVCDVSNLENSDAHSCEAGIGCYILAGALQGTCGGYCTEDSQCPLGANCEGENGHAGLCPTPCNPNASLDCPTGYACASYALLGNNSFAGEGARHICARQEIVPSATADEGAPCEDPPTGGTATSQKCRLGTVCVPVDASNAYCREICEITAAQPCAAGLTCTRPTPALYVSRPLYSRYGKELGYCQ